MMSPRYGEEIASCDDAKPRRRLGTCRGAAPLSRSNPPTVDWVPSVGWSSARCFVSLATLLVLLLTTGCERTSSPTTQPEVSTSSSRPAKEEPFIPAGEAVYEDSDYGFRVNVPGNDWQRGGPAAASQLGEVCRAWFDPENPLKTICLHVRTDREVSEDAAEDRAKSLSEKMERVFNQAYKASIEANDFGEVAGRPAAIIRMNGEGTGFAIDGRSKLPTRQEWVAIPRGADTIFALVSAPTDDFDDAVQVYRGVLKTLAIDDERPEVAESRMYRDEDYGIILPYPEGWMRGGYELGDVNVPGEICRVWSSEEKPHNRIVLFRQHPGKAFTPRELLDVSIAGLKQTLGVEVLEEGVYTVAGRKAMWLVVKGEGTGSAMKPDGPVPMTQHWVAIPREEDIVVAILTSKTGEYPNMEPAFSGMLSRLKVTGKQTPEQQSSK